jgi:hypothetical protein
LPGDRLHEILKEAVRVPTLFPAPHCCIEVGTAGVVPTLYPAPHLAQLDRLAQPIRSDYYAIPTSVVEVRVT